MELTTLLLLAGLILLATYFARPVLDRVNLIRLLSSVPGPVGLPLIGNLLYLKVPPNRECLYSGHRITESLRNVTVRGEKVEKCKRGARLSTVCLSMYSITKNIYYSQMSYVAILLQPEPVSKVITLGNYSDYSPYLLSSFGLPLPPTSVHLTFSESRSYFAITIRQGLRENGTAFLTVLARTKVTNDCSRWENSEITLE
jgi:hypothetical protein